MWRLQRLTYAIKDKMTVSNTLQLKSYHFNIMLAQVKRSFGICDSFLRTTKQQKVREKIIANNFGNRK